SAKDEGSAGEGPPAVPGIEKELREVKSRLLKRCEDLGRELAAMTLDRQEPLITLTGIRQMLERKRLSKKEYLKRASEIEEFLGGLVRNEKSKKQALSVLESLIADLDSRLFRSG
ncbi:MAG: hypothetical protein ABC542_05340, partial [Candidatus Methanosuratincola petrocarbonis]